MNFERARQFIYQNARPLDFARWRFLFEDGSAEDVLRCLEAYQNEDGGFGHGLEPDCWNPNSSPVQTWAATEIIREVGLEDAAHPLIQGILRYLASADAFDGHIWRNTIPSNNDYPHAPWWNYTPAQALTYNPTASLIGFLLKYAPAESPLYASAISMAKEAYAFLTANSPLESMHTVCCFVQLYEYLSECAPSAAFDMDALKNLLQAQIRHVLTQDTSVWSTEYVCRPSLLIHSQQSVFYPEHQALCDFECALIGKTQAPDGSWALTWDWGTDSPQWHISENWWKSDLIIKNLKFCRAMGH